MLKLFIIDMNLKHTNLKLHMRFPGATELIGYVIANVSWVQNMYIKWISNYFAPGNLFTYVTG